MAELDDVLDGVAEAVKAESTGLKRCYTWEPDSLQPPAAWVSLPDGIDYDIAPGVDRYNLRVTVAISSGRPENSRLALARYLGRGENSIRVALEADITLGGVAHTLSVLRGRPVILSNAEQEFLGAEFDVEVVA